jgi:metallo-beta-lactamase family protein
MYGGDVPVRAEVVNLGQFSAHAGRTELLRWLSGFPSPPRRMYLVHGEPIAAASLQSAVDSQLHWRSTAAKYLQTIDLRADSPDDAAAGNSNAERIAPAKPKE